MFDLRERLTRQVVARLRVGDSVVVVGGPGMGKSQLIHFVGEQLPTLRWVDDASPDEAAPGSNGEPTLYSFGVEHYEAARSLRDQVMWVPLSALVPRVVSEAWPDDPERWARTAGHPYLLGHSVVDADFSRRCRHLLNQHPDKRVVLEALQELKDGLRPAERYEALSHQFQVGLKRTLDWLVCAGFVTRMIDGERPGLTAIPLAWDTP